MSDDVLYDPLISANPDAVIYPELKAAYRGRVVVPGGEAVACYSYEAAVEVLIERDGMEPDDAADYIDYNYVGCQGRHDPMWLYECEPVIADDDEASTNVLGGDATAPRVFSRRVHDCVRTRP